jgi:CubicO group peptidase (beta-lactamase class C family)
MIEWRDLRRWFVWAAAVALMSIVLSAAGQWTSDKAESANFAPISMDAIDRFVSDHLASGSVPGLAIAITQGDSILCIRGYGMARKGVPITANTQFFIASLSKSFTALAVMQLVDAGRLDLDAPVQRYLPGFQLSDAEAAARITIRHLLNQTSGLADTGFPEGRLPQPASIRQRVATLHRARPIAAPRSLSDLGDRSEGKTV